MSVLLVQRPGELSEEASGRGIGIGTESGGFFFDFDDSVHGAPHLVTSGNIKHMVQSTRKPPVLGLDMIIKGLLDWLIR